MKTLFQEETSQSNKTPGQTAMKGLFAEQKESGAKTPNQVKSLWIVNLGMFHSNVVVKMNISGGHERAIQGEQANWRPNTWSNSYEGSIRWDQRIRVHDAWSG